MIDLEDVLKTHEYVLRRYGGTFGLRDKGLLQSALDRPFSGFGETEFYPTLEEKAAALLESLIKNHPFMDGNKRAGFFTIQSLLQRERKEIETEEDELYDFLGAIAEGKKNYSDILQWIKERMVSL